MSPDVMTVRLHLRRVRVLEVLVDLPERLEVVVEDTRRVVRCRDCGFLTQMVHDRRRVRVRDLGFGGRPMMLVWLRRRFVCFECGERFLEDHPEFIVGRATHITRRLARVLVRDVNHLSIRELCRRWDLGWHFVMGLVSSWSTMVATERRRRRCRVLMVDETSLRRGHRYVTVLINGETGESLGVVKHRDSGALSGFLQAQGHRWCRQVRVVVTDGSQPYRTAIRQHLGDAIHVIDRFHVTRWFASALSDVRRRIQRIGEKGTRPAFDPDLFRSRYLQLRRQDRLDPQQHRHLEHILTAHPELAHAWTLYQQLHRIYLAEGPTDANTALGEFITAWKDRSLPEFETIITALINWGDEIFAFHDTNRATNGRIEGTNNKLGVLKRIAYGFVNTNNFAHRALLLTPAMPT